MIVPPTAVVVNEICDESLEPLHPDGKVHSNQEAPAELALNDALPFSQTSLFPLITGKAGVVMI